ncbi:hypothetical protein Ancab_022176 [Ancistrocladus abbreviatus]
MGGDNISSTVSCNSSSSCCADSEEESSLLNYDHPQLATLNGFRNPSIMKFNEDDISCLSTQLMKSYSETNGRTVRNSSDKRIELKDDQNVEFDIKKGSNGPIEFDANLRKRDIDMTHYDHLHAGKKNLYKAMESQFLRNNPDVKDGDDFLNRPTGSTIEFDVKMSENVYREVMRSYDELQARVKSLSEARNKILSYVPGTWIENHSVDYAIPRTATLLLIGPKRSGKSNLINRISRVFEDDKFASERAQVSYNSSAQDGTGTYFLQEYMVPRNTGRFCLFDTRSLSDDFLQNDEILRHWMTKGVCHGELVTSAISVLQSMSSDCGEDRRYAQMLAESFHCPHLSFKDDKPVVAVTHGDLLSLDDRARVRVYLGELLGVSPTKQVFDISEDSEPSTELVIVDMIRHCLEHADRNLPCKGWLDWSFLDKAHGAFGRMLVFLVILLAVCVALSSSHLYYGAKLNSPVIQKDDLHHELHKHPWKPIREWRTMRHLWLDD